MAHIYYCNILNQNNNELISYERIYDGSISEQIRIYDTFEENFKRREQLLTEKSEYIQLIRATRSPTRKPCKSCVSQVRVLNLNI